MSHQNLPINIFRLRLITAAYLREVGAVRVMRHFAVGLEVVNVFKISHSQDVIRWSQQELGWQRDTCLWRNIWVGMTRGGVGQGAKIDELWKYFSLVMHEKGCPT